MHDSTTDFLYLADSLQKKKYSGFLERFGQVLRINDIAYGFLPDTKDIWAVDYMPIQIGTDRFVQFRYNPDYLQSQTQRKTITDVDSVCASIRLRLKPAKSEIVLDGGNVIQTGGKAIVCDKVFKENPDISEKELIRQLKDALEIEKLFFVPWDKSECTGHADGMVRFIDNDTVLINDYSREKPEFQRIFRMALHNAGLDWIEIPYNPYENEKSASAEGIYLNYLQMKQAIIVPTFQRAEDEEAMKVLENVFRGQTIATVDSNEIAREGGILNCISWNIQSS